MSPLKLSPPRWRILRLLGTNHASATRAGLRATYIRDLCAATPADLAALADLGYLTGRLHGTSDAPGAEIVLAIAADRNLRIHSTPAGKSTAAILEAAYRALNHLHVYGAYGGALPVAVLHHDAGVGLDTLTQLQRHGHVNTTPGGFLSWRSGGHTHLYGPPFNAGPYDSDPCATCGTPPTIGARIWADGYRDAYCDRCARHHAGSSPTSLVTLTRLGTGYVGRPTPQELS
ncbi:hypothetical protein ACIBKY_55120 [Nonomuraea sp. NPDC050394]|uniref:hypothetical protein n=1 Tax=Nonomuraea sp. NPDC050394 TaxID=3364363 RepID=UPI0037A95D38